MNEVEPVRHPLPRSAHREMHAARRASLAVDRLIRAKSESEKLQAARWANLWGKVAGWPGPGHK